ncbi:hypothetical protein LTSEMIS_3131 [Salmonella enterica subsp. enterica serovar Mississippi str. A4-633]|nr:hypothetical protein LTSEMIS_3131 [Salmonella enterica subsp. enterica serovar Mississippi str. A4-633]
MTTIATSSGFSNGILKWGSGFSNGILKHFKMRRQSAGGEKYRQRQR